ncbi:MAG: DUF2793 domain-containing protein, partial [Rhodobacteraceae bacterium]|nr:DUF2793 domain-containing protein [Paracoccaceae bacterium]
NVRTTPAASPAAGACYIVATPATGAWLGWEDSIAAYIGGAWVRVVPGTGWVFFVQSSSALMKYEGGWTALSIPAPYDLPLAFEGTPTASKVMGRVVLPRDLVLPADFTGSTGVIGTNPDASFDVDVTDDGVSIGTVNIATDGSFTFSTTGGTAASIAAGSLIEFVAPGTADPLAADITFTLKGAA